MTDGGKTGLKYSITRNIVALAVETVTSCCPVAIRLDFHMKNVTQGTFVTCVFSTKADIILAAGKKEYNLILRIIPFTFTLLYPGGQCGPLCSYE